VTVIDNGEHLLSREDPDVAAELRRAGLRGVRSTKGGVSVSRVIVGRV